MDAPPLQVLKIILGSEQPDLVEDVLTHCRGWVMIFKIPFQLKSFYDSMIMARINEVRKRSRGKLEFYPPSSYAIFGCFQSCVYQRCDFSSEAYKKRTASRLDISNILWGKCLALSSASYIFKHSHH